MSHAVRGTLGQDVSAWQAIESCTPKAPGRNKGGSRATEARVGMLGGFHLGPQKKGKPLPWLMACEGDTTT